MSHSVLKFIIFSYFIRKESVIDILWVFLIKQSFHSRVLDMGYYYIGQRGIRQVSNAPSGGIIVDYCVFNSMQHQMDL